MRADRHALQTLDADFFVPDRDILREIALFVLRGGGRERAIAGKHADRQIVAFAGGEAAEDFLHKSRGIRRDRGQQAAGAVRALREGYLVQMLERVVHRLEVHGHDLLAFLAIGLLDGILDGLDGLLAGEHAGQREETHLHDRVDAPTHAAVPRHFGRVDDIEIRLLRDERLLQRRRQLGPDLVLGIGRVQQERSAGNQRFGHVVFLEERRQMAGHEIGAADQIGRTDRLGPEPEMRDGHAPGLLGVIDEIPLRVIVRSLADDLDGILVCAHRAVGAQPVE